jgi:beta-lactamase regulating signal transducer with metallopeptidase domain
MYELLGISLGLAALLTINALASVAAAACWRFIQGPLQTRSARTRAEILFAMRIGPPALALTFVTLFLVPSYIRHEPYATSEVVSKKLAALAILSAIGVTFALWRAWRSSLATRSLRREWLSNAIQLELEGISIPTFRIWSAFPIIAVVGVVRPRLFVAGQVLETLNEAELAAAIAHECGHLSTHDNLKRSLLRFCRDVLMIVPCGRALDRAWAQAAECAADEHAARKDSETALSLASALVKIARMVPLGAHAAVPMAAFLVGVEESGVKARVRRLLEIAADGGRLRVPDITLARVVPVTALGLLLCLGLTGAANPRVLVTVHTVIEHAVKFLS